MLCFTLLAAGCSTKQVVVEGNFPKPLLDPLPITLGVIYPSAFAEHEFFDEAKGRAESDWLVKTGEAQVEFWDILFDGMFDEVVHIRDWETVQRRAAEIDGVLIPAIGDLQYTIPTHTNVKIYAHLDRPEGIYWIPKDSRALYRSFMPEDHEAIAQKNGVNGVVVVQAGQHLPDNQWNLDVTAHNKALYRGVVGNLSQVIGTVRFQPLFDKLCQDDRYLGYRISGRTQKTLTGEFFRDLKETARQGKTVDILIGKYTLEDAADIANRIPNLKIIINHFGGVSLDGNPLDPAWVEKFRAVAKHPNVFCKVSCVSY